MATSCTFCNGSGADLDSPVSDPTPCSECFGTGESPEATDDSATGVDLAAVAAEVAAAVVGRIETTPSVAEEQSRARSRILASIALLADELDRRVPSEETQDLTEYERGQASANAAAAAQLRAVVEAEAEAAS